MSPRQKAALYRELAKLTAADFHLDRSVALLLGQDPAPGRRSYLEGLQRGLAGGKSVAVAIAEENAGTVTGLETSLIEAGERSGTLAAAFAHLERYFADTDNAARQARSAMIYPIVLAHLAIALPELPRFFMAQPGKDPVRNILTALAVLWTIVLGGYVLWRILSRIAENSAIMDSLLRMIPLMGSVRRHWALARFSQVFHSGLLAALRMSEVLLLAGNASQSGSMLNASRAASKNVKKNGESVGAALAATHAFPKQFVLSVATAEEAGSLDTEMGRWAKLEADLASEAIAKASLWLPKIGYGIVVGFVVYRIFYMMENYFGTLMRPLQSL